MTEYTGLTPKMELSIGVLVVREELHHALLCTCCNLVGATLASNLEVDTITGFWVDTAHLPQACVTNTTLGLTDRRRLLVAGNGMTNQTSDLQLLGGKDLEIGVEAHKQVVVLVLVEDTSERLLVHGRCEAVRQDHVSTCGVDKPLHFKKTDLIQTTSKNIDNVTVVRDALG